jgi:hypothetical protein
MIPPAPMAYGIIDNRPDFHYFQDAHSFFKKFSRFFRKPTIWGRNGFDGDKEALVAYRVLIGSLTRWELNIIADDYNYAVAA